MSQSHRIDARLATRVVGDLRRRGVNPDALLKEVGLRRADVLDPDNRIPYAAVLALVERAATTLGDTSYGLRLGAAQEARNSGMLGFLMLNSPTLFDALSNIQRYHRVLGDGEDIEIVRTGPHFTLRFRETDKALRGLRHNSEYIAAIIVRACRDLTRKRISPVRAEFMHGRPNAKVAYADYLGCSVRFHADWDALVYDTNTMNLPVIGADSALLKVLERACATVGGDRHAVVALGVSRLTTPSRTSRSTRAGSRVYRIAVAAAAGRQRTIGAGAVALHAVLRRLDLRAVGQGERSPRRRRPRGRRRRRSSTARRRLRRGRRSRPA